MNLCFSSTKQQNKNENRCFCLKNKTKEKQTKKCVPLCCKHTKTNKKQTKTGIVEKKQVSIYVKKANKKTVGESLLFLRKQNNKKTQ